MAEANATAGGRDVVLTPDPTELTRQSIDRDIAALRDLLIARLDGEGRTITARLDAMAEAIRVAKADLVRVPTDVDKQVGNLKELHAERFAGVQKQFEERDVRVEQSARDTKIAVDAALLAAEKAVGKAEVSTTKQYDALVVTLQTATTGLERQISDLKDRQTRMEGLGVGAAGAQVDMRAWAATAIMFILFLISLVGFLAAYVRH